MMLSNESYKLIRSLYDTECDFDELLRTHGIRLHEISFKPELWGAVYISRKGIYHVFINSILPHGTKQKTFLHELKHIIFDAPKENYIIGMDMQYDTMETEADDFYKIAENMVNYDSQ